MLKFCWFFHKWGEWSNIYDVGAWREQARQCKKCKQYQYEIVKE